MAKLFDQLRTGVAAAIVLSLVLNFAMLVFNPTGYQAFWTSLSPKGHIDHYAFFIDRLICAHILGAAYVWFFANREVWSRIASAPRLLQTHPLHMFAALSMLAILPVHVIDYFTNADWAHSLIMEDGPLEDSSTWFSLLAAGLFLFTASKRPGRARVWALCLAALVFFLFGMEEMSWGQRIFNIPSPEIVQEYNWQDEINLHNFINPDLNMLTMLFFVCVSAMLYYFEPVQVFLRERMGLDFGVDAADSLFFLVFLLALPGMATRGSELGEEYFALLGLILAVRQAAAAMRRARVGA